MYHLTLYDYDRKGECRICSTSTVSRRIDKDERNHHGKQHIKAGDPVVIAPTGECLIEMQEQGDSNE